MRLYIILIMFFALMTSTSRLAAERFEYISTEHPRVTYINYKFGRYMNVTARRYGRHDPFYYVNIHMDVSMPMNNNVTMNFYFYEWLTNVYKPTFVEMHYKLCDLIHKDKFFGAALKQGNFDRPCPFPAGEYHLYNMTIPVKEIPAHFPFTKGRIICNATVTATKEVMFSGHIDMEIKVFSSRIGNPKNSSKLPVGQKKRETKT